MVLSSVEVTAFNGKCNRLQVIKKRISCSLPRIGDYSFCFFLTNFTSKIAACEILSSSSLDSHRKRTYAVESILA